MPSQDETLVRGYPWPGPSLRNACANQIFLEARTHNKWQDKPVPEELLRQLVDIMKMGPASANQSPARLLFVTSAEAKERLAPHLSEGNRAKTISAPVCAIIGYDLRFYNHLPKLFPHTNAKSWFEGKPDKHIETSAFRQTGASRRRISSSRRGRLGSTRGPMSGFDNAGVDREVFFWREREVELPLGYGDPFSLFKRSPRFSLAKNTKIISSKATRKLCVSSSRPSKERDIIVKKTGALDLFQSRIRLRLSGTAAAMSETLCLGRRPTKRNAEPAVKHQAIESSMGGTTVALKRPGEPMLAKRMPFPGRRCQAPQADSTKSAP